MKFFKNLYGKKIYFKFVLKKKLFKDLQYKIIKNGYEKYNI